MRIYEEFTYPASFNRIWQMFLDPDFTRSSLGGAGLQSLDVTVDAGGDELTIISEGTLVPEDIPAQARNFVKGTVKLRSIEVWRRGACDANGTVKLVAAGAPIQLLSNCRLRQTSSETTLRVMDGDLTVSIPFLGDSLERKLSRFLPSVVAAQTEAAARWLESN